MTPAEQLKEAIADLSNKLLTSHPHMPVLLRTIHQQLKADPELVTLISEEEIGTIVTGLKRQTAIEIVTASKTPAGKKAVNKITLADL